MKGGSPPALSGLFAGEMTPTALGLLLVGGLLLFAAARRGRRRAFLAATLALASLAFAGGLGLAAKSFPVAASLALGAPLLAVLVLVGARSGPWAAGLGLYLSGRIRAGDHLVVGGAAGRLEGGDLVRALLVDEGGTRVHLPWSALAGEVHARPKGAPHLARVRIELDEDAAPDAYGRLVTRAHLCPYRVARRPVRLRRDHDRPGTVDIELWSWSEAGARLAEDYLRRSVDHDCPPPLPEPPAPPRP